jgi:hypothetical protein
MWKGILLDTWLGSLGPFGNRRRPLRDVLVNSRAEGNAPLTVQGLVEMLRG